MSTQEQNTPSTIECIGNPMCGIDGFCLRHDQGNHQFECVISPAREITITPPPDYIPTARIVTADGDVIYLVCESKHP